MNDALRASAAPKLGLLATLYFSQGLPFGFFTQALPALLRKEGLSLPLIGATSLLALPWALKFLWAPYVDRVVGGRFGRRRAVILPLQLTGALVMLGLAFVDPAVAMVALVVGVLLTNLVAATQDIATDALAVETLRPHERGLGNGVQVAGYRVGMIVGGGALLIAFEELGWSATFTTMALLLVVATVPIALHKETPRATTQVTPPPSVEAFKRLLARPGMVAWLFVLVVYKSADAMATGMLRPLLIDLGLELGDIGRLLGTIGFGAGLAGALLGGALVVPLGRRRALLLFGVLQALAVAAYVLPTLGFTSVVVLASLLGLEHLCGGMATAALFTLMMDRAHAETAGTDYTVQASVVVIATGLASATSGVLAEALGYGTFFLFCGGLGLAGVWLIARFLYRSTDDVMVEVRS